MSSWVNRAFGLLDHSLGVPRHELNELDWKADISQKGNRLAEHVCAFANQPGGGFFAFGIGHQGEAQGITSEQTEAILAKLSNVGRQNVDPPVSIEHTIIDREGVPILVVRVPESPTKPVHIRGKSLGESFVRSGGTTRQASRQELGNLLLNSRTPQWEQLRASTLLDGDEVLSALEFGPIFQALERAPPKAQDELLKWASNEHFIDGNEASGFYVTNLGAIATAKELGNFDGLDRKGVRVVVYNGRDKRDLKLQLEGHKGYAIRFASLLKSVMGQLPQSEVIEHALRVKRTVYPEIALRELIANALIHQDFTITGTGPMVEIFENRIVISNPGTLLPSKRLDMLIGTQPESRNERLAKAFRRFKICEELGSGLIKVGNAIELYGLPPVKFEERENFFRVTVFSPRAYGEMPAAERLDACYQHACLRYVGGSTMTNKSLRERLKIPERNRSMVSVLIQQCLELHLIKAADPDNTSRKFTEYVPYWA